MTHESKHNEYDRNVMNPPQSRSVLLPPLIVTAALLLSGCNDSSSRSTAVSAADTAQAVSAADLCLSAECSEYIALVDIPDAENLVFSADGRLFVSGGLQVYEVSRDGTGFVAQAIADSDCNFTGLAIRDNVLYAACGGGQLYAGELTAAPRLTTIYTLADMCLPNGITIGPDRQLYVVDATLNANSQACLPPNPRIDRLSINPDNPLEILSQELWLQGSAAGGLAFGLDNQLRFPNGLRSEGSAFFGTDGGSVYAVAQLPGGAAGEVIPLYFTPTELDDLGLLSDGILVTDFFQGRVFLLSRAGAELQSTDPGRFSSPSSVRLGQAPMFLPTDILVTEKGVLGDNNLPLDRLSLLRRSVP